MAAIPDVIVCMTTYPPRIGTVLQAMEPLLHQTVAPDRIVLCLAKDDFPVIDEGVRAILDELQRKGVEVLWAPHTLGPHDKYYWAMKAFPDDIIITVDDDLYFPLWLVEQLLAEHYRHPRAVVGCRSHLVRVEGSETEDELRLAPYGRWVLEQKDHLGEERRDLLATGGAGALYPPRVFDEGLLDEDGIKTLAPNADDLWMFVHELRLGIPVVNTPLTYDLSYVGDTQECALCVENLGRGGNDVYLAKLFERFPEVHDILLRAAKENVVPHENGTNPEEAVPELVEQRRSLFRRVRDRLRR